MQCAAPGLLTTLKFSDVSDAEVMKAVDDLLTEKKHLELENMVFERFLLQNDPALIAGWLRNLHQLVENVVFVTCNNFFGFVF